MPGENQPGPGWENPDPGDEHLDLEAGNEMGIKWIKSGVLYSVPG